MADIRLENVTKSYNKKNTVIENLNLTIEDGSFTVLVGPSGCGKSTTLRMIAGLEDITSGRLKIEENDVTKTDASKRDIAMVFQNYALYPHMTVLENVMFPLTVGSKKVPKAEAQAIAEEYMKLTNIEELSHKKPGTLSGGQQQRVAITRALVQKPDVLLLDEPLSNLDARLRLKIREEIRRLVKEVGITTIFVTHDQEEALSISDKIILLNEGVIQQNDEPQNLYLEPNNLFVAQFIGNPIINLLSVEVKDGKMYHESFEIPLERFEQARFKMPMTDGKYTFASRPEDVVPTETGLFTTTTDLVELIGRERILRFTLGNEQVKSIVSVEEAIEEGDTLSFDFSYKKVFIFNEAGDRVY